MTAGPNEGLTPTTPEAPSAAPASGPLEAFTTPAALLDPSRMVRVLTDDHTIDPALDPGLGRQETIALYRAMVQTRLIDERLIGLQRQGRIGFHVGSMGEEAAIVGAAHALRPQDWIFPCYREFGAALLRGLPLQTFVDNVFGNRRDVVHGRQMPHHYTDSAHHYASVSSPVGTQIPHAAGVAMAARIRGDDAAALTYFGEGATSTGDFHGAINFAAVFRAPAIFLCRNNGWAISVPAEKQTASSTFAAKALAYGAAGLRIDGNDVFAVVLAVRDAIERGRRGDGPTFIEAYTYRTGGHSTSDDPTRYRTQEELAEWVRRDPIERLRTYLEVAGWWTPSDEEGLRRALEDEFRAAVLSAEEAPKPDLETLFDDVYARPSWELEEQRAALVAGPRAPSAH